MCRHRARLILVAIGFILALTACPPTKGVHVAGITVTPATATIQVGQTLALEASVQPGNASQLVTWASDAAAVASVAGNGLVTGVSVGTAGITATSVADVTRMATASITVVAGGGPDPDPDPDPDGGPFSARLIDEALERGDIDDGTALLYHVFAAFGDTRLPTEYQGQASRTVMPGATMVERFDHLSPAAQAIVAPFLLPPSAPGSWLDLPTVTRNDALTDTQASRWNTIVTDNDKVKVWWQNRFPADKATAQAIAQAIDATVWPVLTELMDREPLSDAGLPNNGGDRRFDIYLVRIPHDGMAVPYVDCKSTPAYLLIGNRTTQLLPTVAHEFMHAIQFSYAMAEACEEYYWWMEASAVWAEDFVYPDLHGHVFHRVFQAAPHDTLNRFRSDSDSYPYGAYMWPYFFTYGNAGFGYLIRDIWERTASAASLDAIEGALAGLGGFAGLWPRFALYNWNQVPVDDYQDWSHNGQLKGAAATGQSGATEVDLLGASQRTFEIGTFPDPVIQPLSARYHHYTFPNDDVRSVYFRNGFTYHLTEALYMDLELWHSGMWPEFGPSHTHAIEDLSVEERKGRHVWLIEKIGGEWREPLDVTQVPEAAYCRDTTAERLEELVVIVSNSNHDGTSVAPKGLPPLLHVTNVACHRWTGSLELTETFSQEACQAWGDCYTNDDPPIPAPLAEYTVTLRISDLVIERDPEFGFPGLLRHIADDHDTAASGPAASVTRSAGGWPFFGWSVFELGGGEAEISVDATVEGLCWKHTLGGSRRLPVLLAHMQLHDFLRGPADRTFVLWVGGGPMWVLEASTLGRQRSCPPNAEYHEPSYPLWAWYDLSVQPQNPGADRLSAWLTRPFGIAVATSAPFTIEADGRTLRIEKTLQEGNHSMRIALHLQAERQE